MLSIGYFHLIRKVVWIPQRFIPNIKDILLLSLRQQQKNRYFSRKLEISANLLNNKIVQISEWSPFNFRGSIIQTFPSDQLSEISLKPSKTPVTNLIRTYSIHLVISDIWCLHIVKNLWKTTPSVPREIRRILNS